MFTAAVITYSEPSCFVPIVFDQVGTSTLSLFVEGYRNICAALYLLPKQLLTGGLGVPWLMMRRYTLRLRHM